MCSLLILLVFVCMTHYAGWHWRINMFSCKECGKTYKWLQDLKRHMRNKHIPVVLHPKSMDTHDSANSEQDFKQDFEQFSVDNSNFRANSIIPPQGLAHTFLFCFHDRILWALKYYHMAEQRPNGHFRETKKHQFDPLCSKRFRPAGRSAPAQMIGFEACKVGWRRSHEKETIIYLFYFCCCPRKRKCVLPGQP